MGSSQTTVQGTTSQTTRPEPTAEEREYNRLILEREKFLDPQLRQTQSSGLTLADMLLRGEDQLPGYLERLGRGISPELTSEIVQKSLADIAPSFQQSGLLDSGVRASVEGRVAGDIRRASEEYNIGNRLNLLNLALSGQAQIQQPILGYSGLLASNLQGLRSVTQTGSFNQYGTQTTPFLNTAFAGGIGRGLGSAAGGAIFG